jgi:hypothetical protein
MKLASFALFLAAHAAILALPVQVEFTGSILFAAGFLAFAVTDYTRRPAFRLNPAAAAAATAGRTETHRLAA